MRGFLLVHEADIDEGEQFTNGRRLRRCCDDERSCGKAAAEAASPEAPDELQLLVCGCRQRPDVDPLGGEPPSGKIIGSEVGLHPRLEREVGCRFVGVVGDVESRKGAVRDDEPSRVDSARSERCGDAGRERARDPGEETGRGAGEASGNG